MSETKRTNKMAMTVAEAGRLGYEASVMTRMQGRSGAYTQSGSKGIALEIMHTDKINAENILNPEVKAMLTKQSNAPQVDAVVMNGNKVLCRMQYKDVTSDNGVRGIVTRVKNGDYNATKLYGTTESAKKFNAAAEKAGISKRMIDTKISTETTERIGKQFTNKTLSVGDIGNAMKASAAGTMTVTAIFDTAEGIIEGRSAAEIAENITKDSARNMVSSLVSTGAAKIVGNTLVLLNPAIGIPAKVLTELGLTMVLGNAINEATDGLFDDIGTAVGCAVELIEEAVSDTLFEIECGLSAFFWWL